MMAKRDAVVSKAVGRRKDAGKGGAPGGMPTLPDAKRRPTSLKALATTLSASPMRFLLAEDDEGVRFVIEALILAAYPLAQVRGFANGRRALADFVHIGADLVICDHDMPEMDGANLTRALRRLRPALPILMVSGSPEARGSGLLAGISTFLDKDLVRGGLIREIKILLRNVR